MYHLINISSKGNLELGEALKHMKGNIQLFYFNVLINIPSVRTIEN